MAEEQEVAELPCGVVHVLAAAPPHELTDDATEGSDREPSALEGEDEYTEGLTGREGCDLADGREGAEFAWVELELGWVPLEEKVGVVEEVGVLGDRPVKAVHEESEQPLYR